MTASRARTGEAGSRKKPAKRKPAAAEPSAAQSIDDLDRDEIVAAIREVFSQNVELDRDSAIREVAHALGFDRTGSRIADTIDSALIAAAKRGVIFNDRGVLSLWSRTIGHYSRDELIITLLSVMGPVWWDREAAIVAAARHLGFKRTGSLIRDAFKSAINGAIRRGLIEYSGSMIRKSK